MAVRTSTAALAALLLALALGADAARISDVRGTKHNLSAAPDTSNYTYIDPVTRQPVTGTVPTRSVKATTETQVCVFCHTPHMATPGVTPLWNRQLSTQTYTTYRSETLDAAVIAGQLQQPGGTSKLCLSCHDGSLAIGNVNVLNGVGSTVNQGTQSITMTGTGTGGVMPPGAGATTGFTRNLGIDLTNDHPISVTYDDQLAVRDGELRRLSANQRHPADGSIVGVRASGQVKPVLPLEPTGPGGLGQVQCGTCHDPHLRETDPNKGVQKFLRQPRFQEIDPTTTLAANFSRDQDIICIGCHNKNIAPGVWAYSAHANPLVADELYNPAAAAQREFPTTMRVWQAACLNCHDTHTVQGSRRLLREGTDAVGTPKVGGNPAIEETCYQCHTTTAETVLTAAPQVPNVKTDFLSLRHMPITNAEQAAGTEVHAISAAFTDPGFIDCSRLTDAGCGADFLESRNQLAQRHAECTDCHNPHRVIKGQNGVPGALTAANTNQKAGTHRHEDTPGYTHGNLISGVLRGTWGVEPTYPNASFHSLPSSFIIKRGDPAGDLVTTCNDVPPLVANKLACDAKPYVTREYQICLKCHSNYAYTDDAAGVMIPNSPNRPQLGAPGTPVTRANDTRGHTAYTNQAREFQAPNGHKGAPGALGSDAGAAAAYSANNHRSWHPVMDVTGRTTAVRGGSTAPWLLPWANAVGSQTMYCSDCHGSGTTGNTAMPTNNTNAVEDGNAWGPHGSVNNFILKGLWNQLTGTGQQADGLCFKCHDYTSYANGGGNTGFNTDKGDGHQIHYDRIRVNNNRTIRCSWCHVAVPHGWKNMALLVNLNDVGPEVGLAAGTQVRANTTALYTNGPYYMNAANKVRNFRSSGQWVEGDCGSAGAPGNGQSGRNWMRDSNENCANPP